MIEGELERLEKARQEALAARDSSCDSGAKPQRSDPRTSTPPSEPLSR